VAVKRVDGEASAAARPGQVEEAGRHASERATAFWRCGCGPRRAPRGTPAGAGEPKARRSPSGLIRRPNRARCASSGGPASYGEVLEATPITPGASEP
jgi:hypothetical protein